jgi:diacylglycerol O-acyltransferase / wax synthase
MNDLLSPMEAIMWRVGQDPSLRMTVGTLMILDRPPTVEALTKRLERVVEQAPRLRRRPDDPAGLRPRPAWVDDDFVVGDGSVRELSVAEPGSMRQVLDLVGLLESVPFEPLRSPWDVTLIEGMEGGRAALYLRAHHVLTDGVGGIRLLGLLLDEPEWPQSAHSANEAGNSATGTATAPSGDATAAAHNGDRSPGTLTITVDIQKTARRVFDGVHAAREVHPLDSAVRALQRALDLANSVSRQLMVTGGALSPRPETRSLLSRIEVMSIDGARAAALALGGSRNDLLVAAAAAGLGRYYDDLGQPSPELRLATPTSQHRTSEAGGNWFAPARVEVPTSVGRPGPQFGVVVERLAQSRKEPALQVASRLAATLGRLPTRLLLPALHAQADSVDFAATALPGLRGSRHVCGSLIEKNYPLGPRLGCPMNITAFGNDGNLDIGIALDSANFQEPEHLLECLRGAFDNYLDTAAGSVAAHPAATARTAKSPGATRRERTPVQSG